MNTQQLDNTAVSRHLGQKSEYISQYDKSLLVKELRQNNRTHLSIDSSKVPFVGNDTWNGYEVSALTVDGMPVVGCAKIVYPCDSPYIVESKSIKLYFNSFNMTKIGANCFDSLLKISHLASQDLSELLETKVSVRIYSNDEILKAGGWADAAVEWGNSYKSSDYITIEDEYPVDGVQFTKYSEDPSILRVIKTETDDVRYHSSLLKSNCRVSGAPDFGDVYIYMKGKNTVDPISLLQYIVSFRDEWHFHEEICETIYKRLWDMVQPDMLCVKCLYSQRGGWNICPERASHSELLHATLGDVNVPHVDTPKQ